METVFRNNWVSFDVNNQIFLLFGFVLDTQSDKRIQEIMLSFTVPEFIYSSSYMEMVSIFLFSVLCNLSLSLSITLINVLAPVSTHICSIPLQRQAVWLDLHDLLSECDKNWSF